MNSTQVRASYRRALINVGEQITVRRYSGVGANRAHTDVVTYGRVLEIANTDLVGDVRQGDIKIIALSEDLDTGGFPMPVVPNDRVVVRGKEYIIISNSDSRRVAGVLVAYDLIGRG